MHIRAASRILAAAIAGVTAASPAPSFAQAPAGDEVAFRALYKELVEINTTRSVGSCTRGRRGDAHAPARRGYPGRRHANIGAAGSAARRCTHRRAARPRHRRRKPILLLAHIDVVEAKREDWARDPFRLVEENGWFYARGSSDDKAMASIFTDSLMRYAKQGFKPRRDIKLALTCGEETAADIQQRQMADRDAAQSAERSVRAQ